MFADQAVARLSMVCGQEALRHVHRMAIREAAAHLLHPRLIEPSETPEPLIYLRLEPCPWCGASSPLPGSPPVPLRHSRVLREDEQPEVSAVTLHALACEALTGRSVLLAVVAAESTPCPPRRLATRGASLARLLRGRARPRTARGIVACLDTSETWADALLQAGGCEGDAAPTAPETEGVTCSLPTLPASARLSSRTRRASSPHFLTPHAEDLIPPGVNDAYLRWRASRVATAFRVRTKANGAAV
jgi:hypothetical protein